MSTELPSIDELKVSQKKGAEGTGMSPHSFAECMAEFNHGTGVPVADDDKSEY